MSRYRVEDEALCAAIRRLRSGEIVHDVDFERMYPEWVQNVSDPHWTPLNVAKRAAELLVVSPTARILDIGAGVGKFCLVGALTTCGTFVGIEQRRNLVDIAQKAAQRIGVSRAHFLHGNMVNLDWSDFDGFYLFNPFFENIADYLPPLAETPALSPLLYREYVNTTYDKLCDTRPGTRVVTYHGFGGHLPPDYRLVLHEPAGSDQLVVWEKSAHEEELLDEDDSFDLHDILSETLDASMKCRTSCQKRRSQHTSEKTPRRGGQIGGKGRPGPLRQRVGILANNPHTGRSLVDYLTDVGIEAQVVSSPRRLASLRDLDALIVFPDDYTPSALQPILDLLCSATRPPLLVLVTRTPDRLTALVQKVPEHPAVLLPRPAFGWTILDALRGHLHVMQ